MKSDKSNSDIDIAIDKIVYESELENFWEQVSKPSEVDIESHKEEYGNDYIGGYENGDYLADDGSGLHISADAFYSYAEQTEDDDPDEMDYVLWSITLDKINKLERTKKD